MKHLKETAARVLCAAFVLVVLFSSVCILCEADHDCTGEHCPICHMISMNSEMLRLLGSVILAMVSLYLGLTAKAAWHKGCGQAVPLSGTPVLWKVRLNN